MPETKNAPYTFPPCACGQPMPNGWRACRACLALEGKAWREARDRGEHSGIITVATWRK